VNEYDSWYDRHDEKGYWFVSSAERVRTFSGMGYIFGSRLHRATGVPIGLIDVSRGGTTIESWLSPEMLADMPENRELIKQWNDRVEAYDPEENLKQRIENWERRSEARKKQGLEVAPKPTEPSPSPAFDHNFPGSSYNGYIAPIEGLTVKGVVFHHGYNNALSDARPSLYATNFKALIEDWRNRFNDRELPFGIIELSAGGEPQTSENFEVRMVDAAPYIREGQYAAYRSLQNVGYLCAYDQQVNWYHPQKKSVAGERAARWALSEFYEKSLPWEPARLLKYERKDVTMVISFDRMLKSSDDRPFEGFAIAGSDRHFYPADADFYVIGTGRNGKPEFDKTRIVVSSPLVEDPVAVRYAWARNPLGNMVDADSRIIPLPPFRTDDWEYPEAPYDPDGLIEHREVLRSLRNQAGEQAEERMIREERGARTIR
jgi:sialate O-acetylesterase